MGKDFAGTLLQELKKTAWLLLALGVCFLIGFALMAVIARFSSTPELFPAGALIALLATVLCCLVVEALYQTDFQLAVSFGRTRRSQLAVHLPAAFVRLLLFGLLCWALMLLETAVYGAIFPEKS